MQTDNSHFLEKVKLRLLAIEKLDKQCIKVLDCYAGKGLLWKEVKKQTNKKIIVMSIEKQKGKNLLAINADNEKLLPNLDLDQFDIIDLDAYGIPARQLEIIFKKKYNGAVIVTAISSMMGAIPKLLIEKAGISYNNYRRCPTLFIDKMFAFLKNFLYFYDVQKLYGYFLDNERKYYFVFFI